MEITNLTDAITSKGFTVSALIHFSFRYFLGRQTAATIDFAETLADVWSLLDEPEKSQIKRELQQAFEHQTELGMDCDHEAWQSALKAMK